jgi:LAS superfamily LD-carboxypeptidase LdcB
MLNPLELTGRARTHVAEVPELGCALHRETVGAVMQLRAAARADGIDLEVASGFRSLTRQIAIWNAKLRGQRTLLDRGGQVLERARLTEREAVDAILLWSALPGASRHHWGCDVDVLDGAAVAAGYRPQLTAVEFAPGGIFARLSAWLGGEAARYGFFRPYAVDGGGVMPEPWHLSYAPVAVPALEDLSLEVLTDAIAAASMDAREEVLARLPELYTRYVLAVGSPAS